MLLSEPFYCHEVGVDAAGVPIPGQRVLCRGWGDEVRRRYVSGFYDSLPVSQRRAARAALLRLLALEKAILEHDQAAADRAAHSLDKVAAALMTGIFDAAEAERAPVS